MADILVRGLDAKVVCRLKARAKRHGRSLQSEAKRALETAAGQSLAEALQAGRQSRKKLAKRFSDSTRLIRKDRDR